MSNTLLGGAIADALGVPFESKPANNPLLLSWDSKSFLGSEHHQLPPTCYSDDTQFSVQVAQSLIENGFDPEDLAQRYVELFTSKTIRGYGTTTLMAISNLISGKKYNESGIVGSYGNGTAMRSAPFGIYFRDDFKSLVEACQIDAEITHASDEAVAGSIAIALVAALAVNNDTDSLIERVYPYLPDSEVKKKIYSLTALLDNTAIAPEIALRALGTKCDIRMTVPSVLYCFLRFSKYEDAVLTAIKAGGDTDTTAAIVGALFGAKSGTKGIPQDWISNVEDSEKLIVWDSQLYHRNNSSYMKVK